MYLMCFKTAIVIQTVSSPVLEPLPPAPGALFCHGCAWVCLVFHVMKYLQLLLCTFNPRQGTRHFYEDFWFTFSRSWLYEPQDYVFQAWFLQAPLSWPGRGRWEQNTLIFGTTSLLWVSSIPIILSKSLRRKTWVSWSNIQKYHLYRHWSFDWLHSFIDSFVPWTSASRTPVTAAV